MYFPDVKKFLIVEPLVAEGSLKDKIFGNVSSVNAARSGFE